MENQNNITSSPVATALRARRLMLRTELNRLHSLIVAKQSTPRLKARYRRLYQAELDTDIILWRMAQPKIDEKELDEILERLAS